MSDSLKKRAICSFINLSNLSESLTVSLLSWVTWSIRSQLLICPEWSERIAHSRSFDLSNLSEWAMSKWANSQPCFRIKRTKGATWKGHTATAHQDQRKGHLLITEYLFKFKDIHISNKIQASLNPSDKAKVMLYLRTKEVKQKYTVLYISLIGSV